MFTPLFTPSTKYAVQQKEKQPCKYLQSHYPIPQHRATIYEKKQLIIWSREDMQPAKGSMIVDLGWMEKDEERKWLRSDNIDSIDREQGEDLMSFTISKRNHKKQSNV